MEISYQALTLGLMLLLVVAGCTTASAGTLDQALDSAGQQLDALTRRAQSLSAQLAAIVEDNRDTKFKAEQLSRRLDKSEGKTGACKLGYFPCGSGQLGAVQCVRDYLVCDGSEDCKSGADEAADICSSFPFTKPVILKGRLIRDECRAISDVPAISTLRLMQWNINAADIIPWFPSRPQLSWRVTLPMTSFTNTITANVHEAGTYDFATGDIIFHYKPVGYGIHGRCRLQSLPTEKVRYLCEMDWRLLDEGAQTCIASIIRAI